MKIGCITTRKQTALSLVVVMHKEIDIFITKNQILVIVKSREVWQQFKGMEGNQNFISEITRIFN